MGVRLDAMIAERDMLNQRIDALRRRIEHARGYRPRPIGDVMTDEQLAERAENARARARANAARHKR